MRPEFLPFHLPSISDEEVESVVAVLRSGWLTTGPVVERFQREFGVYIGAPYALALNSGTAALHLALVAFGLGPGDEVIVPTLTFTASAAVVTHCGATPILVDICPDTLTIDPERVEQAITPRTRAIMPVHFGGQPCDMDPLLDIARRHDLRTVEDAAHSLPARYKGRTVGTLGDITCFSFYATKTLTTGEGGMATTANPEWARRMRSMGLHGISDDVWTRYTAAGSWYYEVLSPGFKYNMADLAAAIGVVQLKKVDRMRDARVRIAQRYNRAFAEMPALEIPVVRTHSESAWHLYPLRLRPECMTMDRNRFIEELKKRNIGSSVHFIPLHLHPYYQRTFGYRPGSFPNAEEAFERLVSLPVYPNMTDADVDSVIDAVQELTRQPVG